MDVDDDPMEITMRQETAVAPPNMFYAADDFSDFGNLGDIDQPKYSISSHDSMGPVIQDPSIGVESFSSFGGGVRPGGSLDALGLAGMERPQPHTSLSPAAMDPTPPPIGFFGAPIVPDAHPSMMNWDVQLKSEVSEGPASTVSADGTGSAGPGSVGSFGPGSDAGDSTRRRSDASDTSTSASTTPTGTGPRKARATRRRKSAPDLALAVNPNSQKNFKKEYHNRAERERTRKINNSIQEIRLLTGCVETDKVSILESASKCITEINAGTYKPSPRVKSAASRTTAAAATSPTAMSVVTQSQSPPSAPPAAARAAVAVQPDAYIDISPLFDVMHIAAAVISPDLRIQAANESMGAVIGCDCSELRNQPFLACFHPEDAAHASRTMRHLQQQHFSHRQQLAAQAQLAAHAAALQAAAAQAMDGLNTPPAPLTQHQVPPLQTWEVLTLRISRRDTSMVPASCRISLVLNEPAQDPLGFSFLIDGKQEYKQHDF